LVVSNKNSCNWLLIGENAVCKILQIYEHNNIFMIIKDFYFSVKLATVTDDDCFACLLLNSGFLTQ
jgi:hypothetical protein